MTLEESFTYHKPSGKGVHYINYFRDECYKLALLLEQMIPPSAERTLAVRKVEEASMWANKAISVFYSEKKVSRAMEAAGV